ncbi:hypothetical protein [Secundilactobacillus folii]|uniref:Uncharacterized protein n=1 Tax=Secundilactobacillus folii TaxID=2678357 RepID=A0A7X3C2S8_9LACO|nr:hypothetical protein [Secundilactobacillus folii]MTV81782.1 hypothetical protein [Secundilactobacillus folii]
MNNKLFRGTLAVAVGLTMLGGSAVPANAASWHKGTPTDVRGWWHTKAKKSHDYGSKYHYYYEYFHITKYRITDTYIQSDSYPVTYLKYRKAKDFPRYYTIRGRVKGMEGKFSYDFQRISSKHMTLWSKTGPTLGTALYKFSGKISKHVYYPYP